MERAVGGSKRKRGTDARMKVKNVRRKVKNARMRVGVRQDRLGKFIVVEGKKFRLGRDVSFADVARFAVRAKAKAKKRVAPPLLRRNASEGFLTQEIQQAVARQREREVAEESQREREPKKKFELAAHQARVQRESALGRRLGSLSLFDLRKIAVGIWKKDPSLKRPPAIIPSLIDYILEHSDANFSVPQIAPPTLAEPPPAYVPPSRIPIPSPTGRYTIPARFRPVPRPVPPAAALALAVPSSEENPNEYLEQKENKASPDVLDIHPERRGKGGADRGLSNYQINSIMGKYPEYLGTISHDQVGTQIFPRLKEKSRGGFVINTDPARKLGEHWQAVFFDARPGGDHEVDFFDSYGDPIDSRLRSDLADLAQRLNAGTYLKFKQNHIQYQNDRSSNCGWFAVKFLMDRFRGRPFSEASGWDDSVRGEANIERFKAQYGGNFGYMPSFSRGGALPTIRTDYPPAVRRYLTDTPIRSITVCRKPIQSGVNTLLNVVSLGGWQAALNKVGIDKALHLYMVLNGDTVLERNHVIEMYPGGVQAGSQCMNIPFYPPLTFRQLLERVRNAVGPSLQRYDARTNNCQVFLTQVLRANGILSAKASAFINQNVKGIFENLPSFVGQLAKIVTDTAHRADTVIHGKKKITIREVPPDPPAERARNVQSIVFEKDLWTVRKAEDWLKRNGFKEDDLDEKSHTLRFRQFSPIEPGKFRTFSRTLPEGVEFVME